MKKISIYSKSANSQTLYNFISTVIRSGISFITIGIFTRLMGTEQYGTYSVYSSWVAIFVCLMGLQTGTCISTGYYKFHDDFYSFRSSVLLESVLLNGIITAVLIMLYQPLSAVVKYPFLIFVLILIEAGSQSVINTVTGSWTYEKKAGSNMVLSVSILLFSTLLSIFLLKQWKDPETLYYGRVFGTAGVQLVAAVLVWILLFTKKPTGYNKVYWQYALVLGIPMIFHTLSHQVLTQSDRVMMQMMDIAKSDIGIYSFFYTFTNIVSIILNALNSSWCPFLYDDLDKKNYDALNQKISNYVHVFTVICLGFLMLSREVVKLMSSEEYWPGMPLVPILVMVVYFTYIYQFSVNYEFFNRKPKVVAIGTISAGILNIILNSIMIPLWGIYGAAIATLISYIALAIFHTMIVRHWKYQKYPLSNRPVYCGALMVLIGCGLYFLLADYWYIRWGIGVLLAVYIIRRVLRLKTIF